MGRQVAVVVAINAAGEALIQQRRASQSYGGYWEFPGGKVEAGETPEGAAKREMREETGLTTAPQKWLRLQYGDTQLHFFKARQWRGRARGKEGQALRWLRIGAPPPAKWLPANNNIWKWLQLPEVCAITAAATLGGEAAQLAAARRALAKRPPPLLQLRDKTLPPAARRALAQKLRALTRRRGALLLVNDDARLARAAAADGLHLSSAALMRRKTRPPFAWAGASCHNAKELAQAARLRLDYAVLSPVCKTLTHVAAAPLGWRRFGALAQAAGIPVYALGGMRPQHLQNARRHGGQGVAMMRRAWGDS